MPPSDPWTPEVIARLGTVSDTVIADELGLTRQAVAAKRMVLGIPAAGAKPGPKLKADEPLEKVPLRGTATQRGKWDRAAAKSKLPFPDWARDRLDAAAAVDLGEDVSVESAILGHAVADTGTPKQAGRSWPRAREGAPGRPRSKGRP